MDEPVYEISVHGKDGQPPRPVILWTDPFFRIAHGATELKARLDRAKWYGLDATYEEVTA
jgi:hypothetical protein